MKYLTSEMQSKSHMLSLALSLSTIVILLGIFGLVIVANHRQKKKQQLKAILRAKNLGPVLESRKIAREVSDSFGLARYNQLKKNSLVSTNPTTVKPIASSEDAKPKPPKPPTATTTDEPPPPSSASESKYQNPLKKIDSNEFISGIMYRMRKGEYTPEQEIATLESNTKQPTTVAAAPVPTRPPPETSFYYKEGPPTSSSSSGRNSCGDVHHEVVEVEVNKRAASLGSKKKSKVPTAATSSSSSSSGSTCSGSSSCSSGSTASGSETSSSGSSTTRGGRSRANSYVSKISQQVFVHQNPTTVATAAAVVGVHGKQSAAGAAAASSGGRQIPPVPANHPPPVGNFQGELKEKCMTFFSSVTRTKKDSISLRTTKTRL